MAILFFAAVMLFALNCPAQEIPKIGDTWKGEIKQHELMYVFPPYSMQKMIKLEVDGVKFKGAVTKEKEVVYVSTSDPNFSINGKKYIGQPFSSFEKKAGVTTLLGWGSYVEIDNDWYAVFDYKTPPADTSRAIFVFKGKTTQWRMKNNR